MFKAIEKDRYMKFVAYETEIYYYPNNFTAYSQVYLKTNPLGHLR